MRDSTDEYVQYKLRFRAWENHRIKWRVTRHYKADSYSTPPQNHCCLLGMASQLRAHTIDTGGVQYIIWTAGGIRFKLLFQLAEIWKMAKMMVNAMANSRLYIQDVCKMLVGLAWSYHGFNDNSETTKQLRSGCYPSGKPTPPWDSLDIAVFFSQQGDGWRLFACRKTSNRKHIGKLRTCGNSIPRENYQKESTLGEWRPKPCRNFYFLVQTKLQANSEASTFGRTPLIASQGSGPRKRDPPQRNSKHSLGCSSWLVVWLPWKRWVIIPDWTPWQILAIQQLAMENHHSIGKSYIYILYI